MKNLRFILFFAIFASAAHVVSPHSLTILGGVDSFSFERTATTPPNVFTFTEFEPIGTFAIEGDFTTYASYYMKAESDALLRYMVSGGASFNLWLFKFGVGTFISLMNDGVEPIIPGIIGSAGLELPGGIMVNVEYGANSFTTLERVDGININFGRLEGALWLPGLIVRGILERKSYTSGIAGTYLIRDSTLKYGGGITLYKKGGFLTLAVSGGIVTLQRDIEPIPPAATPQKSSFLVDCVYGDVELSINLSKTSEFILGGTVPYPMEYNLLFFKAYTGFRWTFPDVP